MKRQNFKADDGVWIAADIAGPSNAPTVVLAHGGGQTRHSWARAAQQLTLAGYRVINYDARGHGDSDWSPDNQYPLPRRWADMEMIVTAISEPVAVVGASMGGITAMYGVSQGFRPDALVLVDIVPNAERAGMQRVRDFMASGLSGFASIEEAADAVAAYNPARPRPESLEGLKKNLRHREDGRWYWHWDPGMVHIDIDEERANMEETMQSLGAAKDLSIMLVRGLGSDVVTEESVRLFRAKLPSLEVADIGGAGHMVAGDKNDAFNETIINFLEWKFRPANCDSSSID